MRDGYGFGAEGDWKSAGMDRLLKIAADNVATAFMEDYTLDLRPGHQAILGSHMLEVDPTIASDKPRVEVHPLDIGGKASVSFFIHKLLQTKIFTKLVTN